MRKIQRNIRKVVEKARNIKSPPPIQQLQKIINSPERMAGKKVKNKRSKIRDKNKSVIQRFQTKPKIFTPETIKERMFSESKNTNRVCIINQPKGLGDIIFCEPIARTYYEQGYKILWPVNPVYCNINKHFEYITFVNKNHVSIDYEKEDFVNSAGTLIVPLRFADILMGDSYSQHMASKYKMWNLPLDAWRTVRWKRDDKSEKELYYEILNLKDGEKYNLISQKFLTDQSKQVTIRPNNGLKNVFVEVISDYTLIDWSLVIEKAANIYTVSSAINFIIEFLEVGGKELHLYPRFPEKNCNNSVYLFKKIYNIHTA